MMLAIIMAASCFLYSQAASTKNFIPRRAEYGRCPGYFGCLLPGNGFSFILPNYPTLLAAVELDDTGSTRLGRHIIDHPFCCLAWHRSCFQCSSPRGWLIGFSESPRLYFEYLRTKRFTVGEPLFFRYQAARSFIT